MKTVKKITELFKEKKQTLSFELFPPKTEQGYANLLETIAELARLRPDFVSCTYGAGGGSRDKTFDIVQHIQDQHGIIGVAHLTCVLNSKDQIRTILDDVKRRGIKNILALRGDPPQDQPDWQPGEDNFKYSSELCAFTRKHFGDTFGIGVAGFPEGHLLCPDRDQDTKYLKIKVDNGADFVITQIYFDNKDYFEYVARLKKLGVAARVLPGIIPITDYNRLLKFTSLCGASVPPKVKSIFEPIQNDPEATLKAGIAFAVEQCRELLDRDAPGLHFYCLNKLHPTSDILKVLKFPSS